MHASKLKELVTYAYILQGIYPQSGKADSPDVLWNAAGVGSVPLPFLQVNAPTVRIKVIPL